MVVTMLPIAAPSTVPATPSVDPRAAAVTAARAAAKTWLTWNPLLFSVLIA
jgi:hypothetical protein